MMETSGSVFRRAVVVFILLIVGIGLAVGVAGYSEATREPRIVRYRIGFANWPAATPPMRVVQVSDIHVSWPDMPLSRLKAIVAQVNALKPDLIVLTGDYHGGKLWERGIGNLDTTTRPLRDLRARLGVVAVRGNHDEPYWTPIVFKRLHIPLLDNARVDRGPVTIAGVDDLLTGTALPERAIRGASPDRPLILLSHNPEVGRWMPERVDLIVAGHTHGGQIVLPLFGQLASLSPFLDGHMRGVFLEGPRRMVVSSGVGTSMVPLRLGVPPEIVEMTWAPVSAPGTP